MALNPEELIPKMLEAAKSDLKGQYKEAKDFAAVEFKKLLENAAFLAGKVASGEMTPERAQRHMAMQRRAAETVLLTIEGIGLDAAERAVNAALAVVKDAINAALPVKLL